MMKPPMKALLGLTLLGLGLAACGTSTGGGPQAWLDRPLEGSSHPLAPLVIQAHASDADGVAKFDFYIDDTLVSSVAGSGGRLSEASFEWTPPEPGTYTVKVQAFDGAGNGGNLASSLVLIEAGPRNPPEAQPEAPVSEEPATEEPQPRPTTVTPTLTQTPTQTLTPTPGAPEVTANLDANCRAGPGKAYGAVGFLLKGQSAPIAGRSADSTWWVVELRDSGRRCWIVDSVVEVSGDTSNVPVITPPPLPITDTPTSTLTATATATVTPSPVPDTTPPVISNPTAAPSTIIIGGTTCTDKPTITTVSATVTDESGVSSVVAYWYIGGESGQVTLQDAGGGYYWGDIGPVSTTGTMEIYIYALDSLGNGSQVGPVLVTVNNCVG